MKRLAALLTILSVSVLSVGCENQGGEDTPAENKAEKALETAKEAKETAVEAKETAQEAKQEATDGDAAPAEGSGTMP